MIYGSVFGAPKKCPNRQCKAKFYKDSFLGYRPKTETEVYTIMRCNSCHDTFAIVQPLSMVDDYIKSLPQKITKAYSHKDMLKPISLKEIDEMKKHLYEGNILSSFNQQDNVPPE